MTRIFATIALLLTVYATSATRDDFTWPSDAVVIEIHRLIQVD